MCFRTCWATLYQKVKMFAILGPHSHPPVAIEVKFCTSKRTHVSVGPAKFDVNRCNESPLRGEKSDFWPVSKFNTGRMPRLPVTRNKSIVPRRTMHTGRMSDHSTKKGVNCYVKYKLLCPRGTQTCALAVVNITGVLRPPNRKRVCRAFRLFLCSQTHTFP